MVHINIRKVLGKDLPYHTVKDKRTIPHINPNKTYWFVHTSPDYAHPPRARHGEKVEWHLIGRGNEKVGVKFPNNKLFEGTHGTPVNGFILSANSHITLTVRQKAPKGRHKYAAFVTPANVMAIGSSPPVIIIV